MQTIIGINGELGHIHSMGDITTVSSDTYNYVFNKKNGVFARWGKTQEDDPQVSPFGPEILDIEVTTKCGGPSTNDNSVNKPCPFCYKSNTITGQNMTLDTYKNILDKMPVVLTQVAFGADASCIANPDIFKMMEYTRSKGIIPNITVANISEDVADKIASLCGACAVSRYENKDWCYDSVKRLTDRGMKQVNIHALLSKETYDNLIETMYDMKTDERLSKMNAIVILSLKQKGRGKHFNTVSQEQFNFVIKLALQLGINFGMDSCSSHKFLESIKDHPKRIEMEKMVEPCEQSSFSSYVNVEGKYFPCSFAEESFTGINVVNSNNFLTDVWNNSSVQKVRESLHKCNRSCIYFKI